MFMGLGRIIIVNIIMIFLEKFFMPYNRELSLFRFILRLMRSKM